MALNREKHSILSIINSFLQKIPLEAVRVNINISPSQDGEGDFCIHGGLNGPNLYVLNKTVHDWTNIPFAAASIITLKNSKTFDFLSFRTVQDILIYLPQKI